jgi:membrane complex biogenesis BtpA family protein
MQPFSPTGQTSSAGPTSSGIAPRATHELRALFARSAERAVLAGVVHLLPTPGAPRFLGDVGAITKAAVRDAQALVAGGCDALIVENFGDVPFFADRVPPETIAAMALAIDAVRSACAPVPVGVNVLRNDARAGLGLCAATGASFVRVNVHTGASVTDQGIVEGRAAETLRERARLCPGALILADVHVKHATPLGKETIGDAAADTVERGLADALIVTGASTGMAPGLEALVEARARMPRTPLLVGSGVDEANARELLAHADGAIVGTSLKRGGVVGEPVDPKRVSRLRSAFDLARRRA